MALPLVATMAGISLWFMTAAVPFALLGRSETIGDYPWIDLDFEGYVDTSVDRLVSLGHRRIAVAVPASGINLGYVITRRFRAAMRRHGLPVRADQILPTRLSEQGGYELADRLLGQQEPATAVFLSYELMAIGLYHRLDELGLVPGRDLSVIGLRESAQSRSLFPRLTCYRIDLLELGVALGAALVANMPAHGDRKSEPLIRRLWPMELVPGDSDARARS